MSAGDRRSARRPAARALLATALLTAALGLGAPRAAEAKLLGIIYPESCSFYDEATAALKAHLAANGFGGSNLEIFVQKPAADQMSWINALRKFSAVEADVIVVWGDGLLQTACREKIKTKLGYGYVLEPALSPCAASAGNPSGNAVGVSGHSPLQTLIAKARLMVDFKTVGVFTIPDDKVTQAQVNELKPLERELGFTVALIPVPRREDAATAFRDAAPPGLLLMPSCPVGAGQAEEILTIAAQKKVPTVSLMPPRGGAAAMLSLYPDPEEQGRLLGEQVVQILKGGAPATPLLSPKKIELQVNLPLARQLGAKTPMALLEGATKIIK
jgi:putative ABC transport system substrate-binding protein